MQPQSFFKKEKKLVYKKQRENCLLETPSTRPSFELLSDLPAFYKHTCYSSHWVCIDGFEKAVDGRLKMRREDDDDDRFKQQFWNIGKLFSLCHHSFSCSK